MAIWNYRNKKNLIDSLKGLAEGTMIICGKSVWTKEDGYWYEGINRNWADTSTELAERLVWLREKHNLPYTLY